MLRACLIAMVSWCACHVSPAGLSGRDGGRLACSYDSCPSGCCDQDVCVSGYEDDACGLLGRPCDVCAVQDRCSAIRRCEKRPPDAGTVALQTVFADPGGTAVPPNAEPPARCYSGKCP